MWYAHNGLGVTGHLTLTFPTITARICLLAFTKRHFMYACCEDWDERKHQTSPERQDEIQFLPEEVKQLCKPHPATPAHRDNKWRAERTSALTVQSLGRSPRSGSAQCFLLLALLINLKGTMGFACNVDFLYRVGQGRFLPTKSIVESGTAVHNAIKPETWVDRMLSLLIITRISDLFSHTMTIYKRKTVTENSGHQVRA